MNFATFFEYNNGELFWKDNFSRKAKKGKKCGSVNKSDGYCYVQINKKRYPAHRIIFHMHYGYLPEFLDHINGIRLDNRIENLRPATKQQNQQNRKVMSNNKSGHPGVIWREKYQKWEAYIKTGKYKFLGMYLNIKDAIHARKIAEIIAFKEFSPAISRGDRYVLD